MEVFIKVLILLSFIGMIIVNVLANMLPINGKTTGEISALYKTLFTPAGFTFSIWGLIYLMLLIFAAYLVFIPGASFDETVRTVSVLFIVSSFLNATWLFAWHYDKQWLASGILLGLLVVLALLYRTTDSLSPWTQSVASLYLGWVSVAFTANVAIALKKADLALFMNRELFWLIVVFILILCLAIYFVFVERNIVLVGVFVWALIGIVASHVGANEQKAFIVSSIMLSFMVLLTIIYSVLNFGEWF